ncbi:beta-class carbonic anhydrase [Virgibacillus siamensis]|uniref:beta-class carbonic anhydrase n=1 Tax=Virgibacillus siamensis TaxID=480071 RepID=UPI000986E554|nr:carbonic anhydrase [Virgibacillus siamensis]
MKLLDEILEYNEKFVEGKEYEKFEAGKLPKKKLLILSCMDTRLVELLPKSMNLENGDAKVLKNPGAVVSNPYDSIMRGILVGVYALQCDEMIIVGHKDCGMSSVNTTDLVETMKSRGINPENFDTVKDAGVDVHQFLAGFDNVEESVTHSVKTVKDHPLMPGDVPVHGLVIDPKTGKLDTVVNGY